MGTVLSWPAVGTIRTVLMIIKLWKHFFDKIGILKSTALPSLRKDPEFLGNLTIDQESWIGSIVSLGAVAAGPVGGLLIEILGRKRAMLWLSIPFFLGWILIHFASSVGVILVGRFITGKLFALDKVNYT